MDRRTFVTTSLSAAAIGCATPWLDCYALLSDLGDNVLVVFDATLAASRAYAVVSRKENARRIEIGPDVGILWHRQLRDWPGPMRGVLRPSDCFVLQIFSIADGRAFHSAMIGAGAIALEIGALQPARRD